MDRLDQELIDVLHDCMVLYIDEKHDHQEWSQIDAARERFEDAGGYLMRLDNLKEQLIERQRNSPPPPDPRNNYTLEGSLAAYKAGHSKNFIQWVKYYFYKMWDK